MEIGPATLEDIDWLADHDEHVGEAWIRRCILSNEYLVARRGGTIVGFLRFSRFWGRLPYMDMIRVLAEHRRSAVGTNLFLAWEAAMAAGGARLLMTSSELDEIEPQAWHRRNGFREAGRIDFFGFQPSPEVFFIKDIGS